MAHEIIFLIIGLALIIAGGNYVTNGAVAIANRLKMSPLVIGLTVVAFGSSTPDLVVSMLSTVHGKAALAAGNVVGAVIFDILLVIGIMALVRPIKINKSTLWCDMPILILGTLILFFCSEDHIFSSHGIDCISRIDGFIMIGLFIVFMIYTFKMARQPDTTHPRAQHPKVTAATAPTSKPMKVWLAILCIVGGLGALILGGQWTVNNASAIAKHLGMSDALIGLTIVGIGSSLPDLATSMIAALKGEPGIALGNIVGSCIMDVLFVLGACAIVSPLNVSTISIVNFSTLAISAGLVFAMSAIGKKKCITRGEGAILVVLYIAYMAYLVYAR